MKYTVGYLGNNVNLENSIVDYCNLPENEKIAYINISDMDKDQIDAISFNGFVFDTSLHNDEKSHQLILEIIKDNPDIDVMPVIIPKDEVKDFDSISEMEKESRLLSETTGVSSIPFKITSERESRLFVETVFRTFSQKTIRNIEQIENLKLKSKQDMINALKKIVITLEFKDVYTRDHSLRVSTYAEQIARKMGLPQKDINDISISGWVHDIGKLAINDEILKSTNGSLSDDQFKHIKTHSSIGEVLLSKILPGEESKNIISYAKHHHEKYNGTGYPENIAGEDIPLGARILCVADSFDAMTTKRSYSNPMTLDDAILQLQRCSSTQFDPKIAETFIELLKQEPEILKDKLGITIDKNGFIQTNIKTEQEDLEKEQANEPKTEKILSTPIHDEI